jgi:hypothetical protein
LTQLAQTSGIALGITRSENSSRGEVA